jgi:hypothetical protein
MEKLHTCAACSKDFTVSARSDRPASVQHEVDMNVLCPHCSDTNSIVRPQDESLPLVSPVSQVAKTVNYEDPSRTELEQFRKALLDPLLFEPFTDIDFVRPAAKLQFLVCNCETMIAELRQTVAEYDRIQANLSKAQEIFDTGTSNMDKVRSFAVSTTPFEGFVRNMIAGASLPPLERQRLREKRQAERQLQQEAQSLTLQFLSLRSELGCLQVECATSQLLVAQVWFFLDKSCAAVTKGTQEFYPSVRFPFDPSELFFDGLDKKLEDANLPAITPLMHIFKALFHYIRRQAIAANRCDLAWTGEMLHYALLSYFAWWTDGAGSTTIKDIIAERLDAQHAHTKTAKDFGTKAGIFGNALLKFIQSVENIQSGKRQTI